jgi:hypothetical protein
VALFGISLGVVKFDEMEAKISIRAVTVCALSTQALETPDPLCR